MSKDEESDKEIEFREENERQIAMMIVDALWHSKWIRLALQYYEYHGKGFDGIRQLFGRTPPEENRPRMRGIKQRLEELVLNQLRQFQYQIHCHEKKNKRMVTAVDLYKPNKRRMVSYGLDVDEVSLTRDAWEVFERTEAGKAKYLAYLLENGVDPRDVVKIDSV